MMICGVERGRDGRVAVGSFSQHPLPPGVSVAQNTNETCVINPCNGAHEFSPEQRLQQPPRPVKRGMYSFHVLC